jgi:hypothetical protein
MIRYARQLQPLIRKLKTVLKPLKEAKALGWFQEVMNWNFDPFFNYHEIYNVSTDSRVPKWSPDFAFHGSGSRLVAPAILTTTTASAIEVIADATNGFKLEPISLVN